MAIVIRVVYNNKDWKAPCDTPGKDDFCWYCFTGFLGIKPPRRDDIICSGDCWERRLCKDYKWGCTPKGRVYGPDAYQGASVFLVFKQPDSNYTVWGKTTVSAVDTELMKSDNDFEDGFAFIHFNPFEPLPRDEWVTDLSDVQLVGARWLQGRHRYIDTNREKYLDQLIERGTPEESIELPVAVKSGSSDIKGIDVTITMMPNIYKKLEGIATEEGRNIDELVREAIAGWIRNR
jgi:hypothetical protein